MIGSSLRYPPIRPLRLTRHAQLLGTGVGIPEQVVTNQDIIDQFGLIASDRAVQFSIGIKERRHVANGNPPSKYLNDAAAMAIANAGIEPDRIDRILYARLAGDHAIPSTALRVLERLGLRQGIPVMDVSVACSGFLHATELALSFIDSGDDHVLVVAGDRAGIDREAKVLKDTRTIFLNGDGFAAAVFGHSPTPKFKCSYFYTDSSIGEFAYIPFGTALFAQGKPLEPGLFNLTMPNGPSIHQSIVDSCRIVSQRLLTEAGLTIDDIDVFVTSDQTTLSWKAQLDLLGIPESKSASCFHKYGNTVAAMVPLNLHEAIATGKLRKGMTVLLMGHGAGASGGGFVFTY
jgi:3-oxoacyl-[acyl-carrier-protein] synthase III